LAQRALARPTSGSGFTSWPTPQAFDALKDGQEEKTMGPWRNLVDYVLLTNWPTPTALSFKDSHQPGMNAYMDKTKKLLTGWPTTRAADGEKNVRTRAGAETEIARKGGPQDLIQAAHLAGWQTPRGEVSGDTMETHEARQAEIKKRHGRRMGTPLEGQALSTDSGPAPNGSPAATGNGGQLNPMHSLWLQGLPMEWVLEAPSKARAARGCSKPPATQ
jgi:hypothetical protein